MNPKELNNFPDVRDGFSEQERIVLYCMDQLQKERGGRNIPTVMLYGRVLEYVQFSGNELQDILHRFSNSNT